MYNNNNVTLRGNLGKDPETRVLENGSVTRFSLATNETYKDNNGEWQSITEWHIIVCWNKLSDKAQSLKKGDKIIVYGKIKRRSYQDAAGVQKDITEIVASYIDQLQYTPSTAAPMPSSPSEYNAPLTTPKVLDEYATTAKSEADDFAKELSDIDKLGTDKSIDSSPPF